MEKENEYMTKCLCLIRYIDQGGFSRSDSYDSIMIYVQQRINHIRGLKDGTIQVAIYKRCSYLISLLSEAPEELRSNLLSALRDYNDPNVKSSDVFSAVLNEDDIDILYSAMDHEQCSFKEIDWQEQVAVDQVYARLFPEYDPLSVQISDYCREHDNIKSFENCIAATVMLKRKCAMEIAKKVLIILGISFASLILGALAGGFLGFSTFCRIHFSLTFVVACGFIGGALGVAFGIFQYCMEHVSDISKTREKQNKLSETYTAFDDAREKYINQFSERSLADLDRS